MAKNLDPKCKQCRREGEKLFLKGDRCFSSKCAMVKRNYPPGAHGAKGRGRLTSYGQQLREKQKAKRLYGVLEKQFRNYFKKAVKKTGDTGEILSQSLELRFDNIVYRLGFAKSRRQARQLINHGHFLVNDKKINIPSYQVESNDVISIRPRSLETSSFKNLAKNLEKYEVSDWLILDIKELKGRVATIPKDKALDQGINMKLIVEYYSR